MRIGFLIWNGFQFYHFRSIIEAVPDATLFIDVRPGLHRRFPYDILKGLPNPVVKLTSSNLAPIADAVDVLVVQSNTDARAQLPDVKIVAMQYSLSKEWHQYGRWMQEADLVLCFGDYSRDRIDTPSPVIPVGNPRMDDYFAGRLDAGILAGIRKTLDPRKPTIMVAPSWSSPQMVAQLKTVHRSLGAEFNILWSPHHNTRIFGNRLLSLFRRNTLAYDRYLYYLKVADILVSDTSGALFDALHAGKHVIVADFTPDATEDRSSIEFLMRESLGPVAHTPAELGPLARDLMSGTLDFKEANASLREACFCCNGQAATRIVAAIQSAFDKAA